MDQEYRMNFKDSMTYRDRMNFFVFIVLSITPMVLVKNPYDYADLPKLIFLCGVTLVILTLSLLRIQKESNIYRIEDWLIWTYLILVTISTLFSWNVLNSIFGHLRRYEGLIALLIYTVMFYLPYRNFKFKISYFNFFVFTAIILALYGVIHYFEILPVIKEPWKLPARGRGTSTFGNPNFLGSYLTLVLPPVAYAYIYSGKYFYLFGTAAVYMSLLTSFTRSGWLGSLFGFLIIFILTLKFSYNRKHLVILIALLLIITLAIDYESHGRVISRFVSIQRDAESVITQSEDYEKAGANRMFIWVRVVELIKEKPVFGHGLESMGNVFSDRYMDEVVEHSGRRIIFDKAHNEYLHMAYSTGIPSLIVYLAFVVSILRRASRKIKNNHLIIPIFASISGYLVQAFFNISVVSVAYIFWILLGILLNLSIMEDKACMTEGQNACVTEA